MSYTTDLLAGVAQLLDTTIPAVVWRASGVYTTAEMGVYIATMPQAPDGAVVLSDYPVGDDPTLSDSVIGLQVRTRTGGQDPRTTTGLDDDIFDVLHGLHDVTVGGIRLVGAERRSGAPLGQDGNGRHERTSNYYLTVHRPSPNRS